MFAPHNFLKLIGGQLDADSDAEPHNMSDSEVKGTKTYPVRVIKLELEICPTIGAHLEAIWARDFPEILGLPVRLRIPEL